MAWHPFRNIGLKMAALALGTLLWLTVSGERVERKVPRVPILYRNPPASLVITDQPDSVDVSVRGKSADLGRLQDMVITADLSGATAGANVLPLRVDQVSVPQGVEVLQVDPGTVTVWLERSEVMSVPIIANIVGEPAPGFRRRGDPMVEPGTVRVTGPVSQLKPNSSAVTERVSIEGRRETLVQQVAVGVGDAQLRLVAPSMARVTVVIEPEPVERSFESRPVAFANLSPGLVASATPALIAVTLRGTPTVMAALVAGQVVPTVDAAGLSPGVHMLEVRVQPPTGVVVTAISPALVSVQIR
jgi:YbbR domain-containing protein